MSRRIDRLAIVVLGVGLTLLLVAVVRGGNDDVTAWSYPDEEGTTLSVGGVARMNDLAVADAHVALGIDDDFFTTPESSGTTAADGSFVLQLPGALDVDDAAAALFIQITVNGQALDGGATAPVQLRRPVKPGSMHHDIAVPTTGECADDNEPCELELPDLRPVTAGATLAADEALPADSVRLDTDTTPGRTLLRFSTLTANIGEGPLHVVATGEEVDGSTPTIQRLWRGDLAFDDRMAGVFVFHPGHDHIHVEDFERYRLLDLAGTVVRSADKISYCLRDSVRMDDFDHTPRYGIYVGIECGASEQAVNPGFADYYGAELADQWIDVTGVPGGEYLVEITVDPANYIIERDESNNVVTFPVTIPNLRSS